MISGEPLDWKELASCWRYDCERLAPKLLEPLTFERFAVNSPSDPFDGNVDWWPSKEFEERRQALSRFPQDIYWTTTKGTLNTARLLWEYQGDAETLALIFMGAFFFETAERRDLYRGPVVRIMNGLIRNEFWERGLSYWHHLSTGPLPICPLLPVESEYYGHYVELAVIATLLSLTSWRLIVLENKSDGS